MAEDIIDRFLAPALKKEPESTEPAGEPAKEPVSQEPAKEPVTTPIETGKEPQEPAKEPDSGGEPAAQEPAKEPEKPDEFLERIRKIAGEKYKIESEEDINKFFEDREETLGKMTDLEKKAMRLEVIDKYLKDNYDKIDPVKRAGGEENYKKGVLINSLADGRRDLLGVASDIVDMDIDNVPDEQILIKFARLTNPKLNDKKALMAQFRKMQIDTSEIEDWNNPMNELDEGDVAAIQLYAGDIRSKLRNTLKSIQIPEPVDFMQEIDRQIEEENKKNEEKNIENQKNIDSWKEAKTSLRESFSKIKIGENFEFEIPEEDKKWVDDMIEGMGRRGDKLSDANKQRAIKAAENAFVQHNWEKIIAAFEAKIVADQKALFDKERHNLEPLGTTKQPPSTTGTEKQAEWKRSIGLT